MFKQMKLLGIACIVVLGVAVLAVEVFTVLAAPPTNDNFVEASLVPGLPFSDSINTAEATAEPTDPAPCGAAPAHTIWYAYTPANDMLIDVQVSADYGFYAIFGVYTGSPGSLTELVCGNNWVQTSARVNLSAGQTYYFELMAWNQGGGPYPYPPPEGLGGNVSLSLTELPPPPNDNFANAVILTALPFSENVNTESASTEAGEPQPSCAGGLQRTVWYAFTPATSGSYSVRFDNVYGDVAVGVYTGTSLSDLSEVGCKVFNNWGSASTFHLDENTTYYFQAYYQNMWWSWSFIFNLYSTPPPNVDFIYYPSDPSLYDNIQFYNYSNDPGNAGYQSTVWDFGDGATSGDWTPVHRFAVDGDYTVQLTLVTNDGRTGTISKQVRVRTHDVAVTKFVVPQSASKGQTRQINVEVNNQRYPETVTVQLYKSTQGGFVLVGTLTQYVPLRPANRTTQFAFNYTFTNEDAAAGKVTFKAVVYIEGARDAWPADNEAIALPTKVTR